MHNNAPNRKETVRLCWARLPKTRLVPMPVPSMMIAFILRTVALLPVVIRRFCSSVCKGCRRLKAIRRIRIAETESQALSVTANKRQDKAEAPKRKEATDTVPSFFVSFADRAPHKPEMVTAM